MSEQKIVIDGKDFDYKNGETILDVARNNGIDIPTLCHLAKTTPTGACRMCVVEVEKARSLVTACTMPAANGMIVKSESNRVVESRKRTVELLLASGNHNCASRSTPEGDWNELQEETLEYDNNNNICEVYGDCKLQEYAYRYQADSSDIRRTKPIVKAEFNNPYIIRDFSRCILCGRCVQACNDIQVNNAISNGYRGETSKIVTGGDQSLENSDCVFCGECIQACPVGALVDKNSRYKDRMWESKTTTSTCYYCGVGCQLEINVSDGKIIKINGKENSYPNNGSLCRKGRYGFDFLNSKERLLKPQIKKDGKLVEVSMDEALSAVVNKINELKSDPSSIACIAAPKSTTEDFFVMQKFFRDVVKTQNITQSEQIATSGAFMKNSFEDFENSDLIILVASDIQSDNPVAASYIKRGINNGGKLLVLGSNNKLSKMATQTLLNKDGTDGIVLNSMVDFIAGKTDSNFMPKDIATVAGITEEEIKEASELVKTSKKITLIYSGVNVGCSKDLKAFSNISNDNINCITGNNNTVGAVVAGAIPGYLPGFKKSNSNGLNSKDLSTAISDGKIKLLYCVNESIAAEYTKDVFTIVQDSFITEASKNADIVIPSALWSEYEGTFINSSLNIGFVNKVVDVAESIIPTWQIFLDLAKKCNNVFEFSSAKDIWEKGIASNIDSLSNCNWEDLKNATVNNILDSSIFPNLIFPGWRSASYHHKALQEKCENLELVSVIDLNKVAIDFEVFLKNENSLEKKEQADAILKDYYGKKGSIIPVLQKFQLLLGYLPEVVQLYVARGLKLAPSDVYGIISFYHFFTMKPKGKYVIKVCMGTACYVMGAGEVTQKISDQLGIKIGETTEDRKFTLETVRCVGACGIAPVVVVNDDTHGKITAKNVNKMISEYTEN